MCPKKVNVSCIHVSTKICVCCNLLRHECKRFYPVCPKKVNVSTNCNTHISLLRHECKRHLLSWDTLDKTRSLMASRVSMTCHEKSYLYDLWWQVISVRLSWDTLDKTRSSVCGWPFVVTWMQDMAHSCVACDYIVYGRLSWHARETRRVHMRRAIVVCIALCSHMTCLYISLSIICWWDINARHDSFMWDMWL